MTIAEAKAIVRAKYPKATAIYSSHFDGIFINESRYVLKPVAGNHCAFVTHGDAWKAAAKAVQR